LGFPAVIFLIFLIHIVFYFVDPYGIRQYPGPFLAKITPAWLGWVAQQGHRSEVIHELHKKYGPFVRVSPSELSIADPEALGVIYGHGNGALKSSYYDAFLSIAPNVFTTRDRAQHARKRKIVSHIFSKKSVLEFQPHIRLHIATLLGQWDRLYDDAVKGLSGTDGEGGWTGHEGRLWLDCLPWLAYLAFDIIGDLAFGSPFGMLASAQDTAPIPATVAALVDVNFPSPEIKHIPAIAMLNGRGEYTSSMAVLPAWWRPFIAQLAWYRARTLNSRELSGMAIVAVAKRLAAPTDRVDILSKLQEGKDESGQPLGRKELTVEAQSFLGAGSDTTSNSITAIVYHLAANPAAQARLQEELDESLDDGYDPVATYEQIKNLPYLDACIHEALRIHATSALGLPRVVPEGGLVVLGRFIPAGTVVGVPTYTIHRDPDVWGYDSDLYRPERWLDTDKAAMMHKTFNVFSAGPRVCVGRNLAELELLLIVATLVRRYHFVLAEPEKPLATHEGFLRKPVRCDVGIKRRDV